MAHYRKVVGKAGTSWRADVDRKGHAAVSKSFATKAEARAWATALEADIHAGRHGGIVPRTLGQALQRYSSEISPSKRGHRWEQIRLAKLEHEVGCSGMLLQDVRAQDLAAWRDS